MKDEKRDNIEVCLNKNGTLDEIFLSDPNTGTCLLHMEQMDDNYYWMRLYGITQDLVVDIGAVMGQCRGKAIVDENNCIVGREEYEGPKIQIEHCWDDSVMEEECGEKFATSSEDRRVKVAEIINRFGVACVLREIIGIYEGGRKADHEKALIEDLTAVEKRFLDGDRKYWDERIKNTYGKEP